MRVFREGHGVLAGADAVADAGHVVAVGHIGDDGTLGGRGGVVKHLALERGLAGAPVDGSAIDVDVILVVAGLVLLGDLVGLEAVGDGGAEELGVVGVVLIALGEVGGEGLEALGEVEVDGVGVALALGEEVVEAGELRVLLVLDPRRVGRHVERVVGQVELELAHQAVAAQVGHLVVLQDVDDVVAGVVLLHVVARAVVVARDGEEDLVILADQLVPEVLAVLLGEVGGAVAVDTGDLVSGEDDGEVRVLVDDLLGPIEGVIRRAETQREQEVLLSLGLEDVVLRIRLLAREAVAVAAVVDARGLVAGLEGGVLLRALLREVLLERGRAVLAVEHEVVVVARQDGVVEVRVLQRFHRLRADVPGVADVGLVDDITKMRHELGVQVLVVLCQELGLHVERVRAVAGAKDVAGVFVAVAGVELGVRKHAEGEAGGEVRAGFCAGFGGVRGGERELRHRGEQGERGDGRDVCAHGRSFTVRD
ncbi:hypothetical protein COGO111638_12485 [Corynebacterium gottingense]